jgi:hypothetical protein
MSSKTKLRHLTHTPIQAAELEKATWRGKLPNPGTALVLGDAILDLVQNPTNNTQKDLAGPLSILANGGTLQAHRVEDLARHSGTFKGAVEDVITELSDLTGGRLGRPTIKSYNPKNKVGLGPHRDANLDAPESLVTMTSVLGLRDSALWAVPQLLDFGMDDKEFMFRADRRAALERIRAKLENNPVEVTPFDVATQKPGDVTMVDERPEFGGIWEDPRLGTMAAWHSVYGSFDPIERGVPGENLVVSMIARTQDPNARIPSQR